VVLATTISISVLALILINLVYQPYFQTGSRMLSFFGLFPIDPGFYFRLVAIVAVLDVLGTIATPILMKISSMKK